MGGGGKGDALWGFVLMGITQQKHAREKLYCTLLSISISPSWARAGCKKTLSLIHYPCEIKVIHSFIHSLSLLCPRVGVFIYVAFFACHMTIP